MIGLSLSREITQVAGKVEHLKELAQAVDSMSQEEKEREFEKFSLCDLVDYLKSNHDYYLNKKLPEIEQSISHVFGGKEEMPKLLKRLALFFDYYKNELVKHIKMEEEVFFPMVEQLENGNNLQDSEKWTPFMEFLGNHDSVEDELKKVNLLIKETLKNVSVPFAYRVFMNQVDLFEQDLRKHAIIEDEVLLPRVESLIKI